MATSVMMTGLITSLKTCPQPSNSRSEACCYLYGSLIFVNESKNENCRLQENNGFIDEN